MTDFNKSNWAKRDFIQQYRENADIYVVERQRMFGIMKSFYTHYISGKNNRILDLGCGDGIVTDNLISLDGSLSATLVDASKEMLDQAKKRLKGLINIEFVQSSFQDVLVRGLADRDYDFIVSSMSIHHLTKDEKLQLFRLAHSHLKTGGYFMNIDVIIAPTPSLEKWYMKIWEEWMDDKRSELEAFDEHSKDVIKRYKDAEENQPDTLDEQLDTLKDLGFREVDCFYKYGIFAVYGGMKREEKNYFPDI